MTSIHFLALTTDSASANDLLVKAAAKIILSKYGIPFTEDAHIRCILHAINLTVQDTLSALDEAPSTDEEDLYNSDKEAPPHWDPEEDNDQQALDKEKDTGSADTEEMDNADDEDDIAELQAQSQLKRVRHNLPFDSS